MLTATDKTVLKYILEDKSKYVLEDNWAQIFVDLLRVGDLDAADVGFGFNHIFNEINVKVYETDNTTYYWFLICDGNPVYIAPDEKIINNRINIQSQYARTLCFKSKADAINFAKDYNLPKDWVARKSQTNYHYYQLPYKEKYNSFIFLSNYN